MPLAAYSDFETTAPTDNSFNPEKKRIFVVSYVIVFAFHPTQNLDRTVVKGSFGYSYKILTTIDYLTNDQIECMKLVKQSKIAQLILARENIKIQLLKCFVSN